MQIVINIPDFVYNGIRNMTEGKGIIEYNAKALYDAIYYGTPLPKHGRLIDADELYGDFIDGTEGYDCQTWNRIEIGDIIEDAPTIIEADEAESEGEE